MLKYAPSEMLFKRLLIGLSHRFQMFSTSLFQSLLVLFFVFVPCFASFPAPTHAAFDYRISLIFFLLDPCFNQIPKPTGLVSWSQICLLNSIAVFETVRPWQKQSQWTFTGQHKVCALTPNIQAQTIRTRVKCGLQNASVGGLKAHVHLRWRLRKWKMKTS